MKLAADPHRLGYSQEMALCRPLPQQPSCLATCLISANCAGGRERQRPASGSLPLGLMSSALPSPLRDWQCTQGRVKG